MSCISKAEFYRIYRKEPVHREIDREISQIDNWHNLTFCSIYDCGSSLCVVGPLDLELSDCLAVIFVFGKA